MIIEYFIFLVTVVLAVVASILTQKLTVTGGIAGGLLAIIIYLGVGIMGIIMLGLFFLLGTMVTTWRASVKNKIQLTSKDSGRRTLGQVLANGGVAGLVGLLAITNPQKESLWLVMVAGSFASALADTLSSELGTVYGKKFYNILNFKIDQRGLDGVVSIEGLVIGIAGSVLIATVYCFSIGWNYDFWIIVLAGTIGNLTDSILGVTLERKGWIKNNSVNFFNTLVGAITAGGLFSLLLF